MASSKVVVVGAGVVGLTTALLLSKRSYDVTIIAKHMPGDYSIEYASPWAGANFWPTSAPGTPAEGHDARTFPELWRLATTDASAGIHVQDSILLTRTKDAGSETANWSKYLMEKQPWFIKLVPEFRVLEDHELPPGIDSGTFFKSVCINCAIYLPWLMSQCLARGVVVKRADLEHIKDAADLHASGQKADVVVNCTGLMARSLGGVMDKDFAPRRGQVVVVRNEAPAMYVVSGTDDGPEENCYIMMRAAGGGTILGGSYQAGNEQAEPDMALAERIMKRAVELCPALIKGKEELGWKGLSVVRHGVGLRPARNGGVRLEKEVIEEVKVVHNYGAGGFGYQSSYGMAEDAVELVDEYCRA